MAYSEYSCVLRKVQPPATAGSCLGSATPRRDQERSDERDKGSQKTRELSPSRPISDLRFPPAQLAARRDGGCAARRMGQVRDVLCVGELEIAASFANAEANDANDPTQCSHL